MARRPRPLARLRWWAGEKATLEISTHTHNAAHGNVGGATTVPLGSIVHDTATVTGEVGSFGPGGVLTFRFFTMMGCTGDSTSPATGVEAGFYGRSAASAALAAGSYSYDASIAADDNYNAAGPAPGEPLTVDKANLEITTQIHNAAHGTVGGATTVPLGSIVHDTATVTGQGGSLVPSGGLTFRFFPTID